MGGVGDEYAYCENDRSTEHIVPRNDNGSLEENAICGMVVSGKCMGVLADRVVTANSVYGMLDRNSYTCDDCRTVLLDRLGLPDTREEANEQLGREVY